MLFDKVNLFVLHDFSFSDLLEHVLKAFVGVDLEPAGLGLFLVAFINSSELLLHFLLIKEMQSPLLKFFAGVLVRQRPGLHMLTFLPETQIEVHLYGSGYLVGVILLIHPEILDVVGNGVNLFLGECLLLLLVLEFLEDAVDVDPYLVVVLLALLLGEGGGPVEVYFGYDDVVQFVVVVVVLEEFLALLEVLDFYLVLELLHQQFAQVPEALDFVVFEEVVDLHEDVLLVRLALQERQRRLDMTVYPLDVGLQP